MPLSLVTALGGKRVDLAQAADLGGVAVDGHPVAALVAASKDGDILVVGSRGPARTENPRLGLGAGCDNGKTCGARA